MPSIAQQDFKIFGLVPGIENMGIPAACCAEYHAAALRAIINKKLAPQFIDCLVFSALGETLGRILGALAYFDEEKANPIGSLTLSYDDPTYYDALQVLQVAECEFDGEIYLSYSFQLVDDEGGILMGISGNEFINEEGYYIVGTADDNDVLTSLSLGEKSPYGGPVVNLESLQPLVGRLKLNTTEIF